jgi:hypothetical protein
MKSPVKKQVKQGSELYSNNFFESLSSLDPQILQRSENSYSHKNIMNIFDQVKLFLLNLAI